MKPLYLMLGLSIALNPLTQVLAQECGTLTGFQHGSGVEEGVVVTLNFSVESTRNCNGNDLCTYSEPGYAGDWSSVRPGTAQILYSTNGCGDNGGSADVEGLGEFALTCQGFVSLNDAQFNTLVSTISGNDGLLKVTNTGSRAIGEFEFVILSQDMCACFAKAEETKVVSWKSAVDGDFSDGSRWDAGSSPGADSTGKFGLPGAYTVSLSKDVKTDALLAEGGGTVTLDLADKNLEILEPDCSYLGIQSDNAILRIQNGELKSEGNFSAIGAGSIFITDAQVELDGGSILLGDNYGRGSLTVSDSAEVHLTTPEVVDVGSGTKPQGGDLLVEQAGVLNVDAALSFAAEGGLQGNASTGRVEDVGSKLSAALLVVGAKGEGALSVVDSAYVYASTLRVGSLTGGFGTVDVEDSGTLMEIETGFGRIFLGENGNGFLHVRNGARVLSPEGGLTLGDAFGGEGRLTVEDMGSFLQAGSVKIGVEGHGQVTVRNGATAEFFGLEIASGVSSAQTSELTVEGVGARLDVTEPLTVWIARSGHGKLSVLGGGQVNIPQDLYVAVNLDAPNPQGPADGSIRVSGSNSALTVGGDLRLGDQSEGTITIENSAKADLHTIKIGYKDGADSLASRLEITTGGSLEADVLSVGRGHGVARIRSGGQADVAILSLGISGTGYGEVQVEDPGSVLRAQSATVGVAGEGYLNTFSGGSAVIKRLTINKGIVKGNVTIGKKTPKRTASVTAVADSAKGTVETDTLVFNEGAEIDADSITFAGGLLGGSAEFPFLVTNNGVVSPGDSAVTPGIFTAGAGYEQTEEGILHIELAGEAGGEEHDELVVVGTASLAGTLRLTVPRGYPYPEAGTTYRIVSADVVEGTFETIDLQEGLEATVNYSETEVIATVTSFVPVSAEEVSTAEVPSQLALYQNYPNPFNPSTTIRYDVAEAAEVGIRVFDALGRLVEVLGTWHREPGTYSVTWEAGNRPSGVYFYRLETAEKVLTGSMFLTR